jgi:hypothetical protein
MFKRFKTMSMRLKEPSSFSVGTNNLIETNILSKKFKGANYSQPMMFNQQYAVGSSNLASPRGQVEEKHDTPARRTIEQINSLDFSNYLGKN